MDWALKAGFKLKGYFKQETLASRKQSPHWLEPAGEGAGAATGGLERWVEVKVARLWGGGLLCPLGITRAEASATAVSRVHSALGVGVGCLGPAVCTVAF